MIKYIITGILSAGAGLIGGYLLGSNRAQASAQVHADAQIKGMEAYYKNKYGVTDDDDDMSEVLEENVVHTDVVEDFSEVEASEETIPTVSEDSLTRNKEIDTNAVDYTRYYGGNTGMSDTEYDENYALGKQRSMEKKKGPHLIKSEDFGVIPGYSTRHMLYYQYNDTLVIDDDQDEEVIEDFNEIESIIGDALTKYGFRDNDEEIIYVRNDKRDTDYEIEKVFDSYEVT